MSSLLTRRTIVLILICVIMGAPLAVFGYAEFNYGGYGSSPSANVEVYTLEDIWYPQSNWQPYPLLIKGNMSSYYSRPLLMCPYEVVAEVFIEDITNTSSEYSWINVADYAFLRDGGYVNTTVTPFVTGNFGDGEQYVADETEWTYWPAEGLPTVSTSLIRGISNRNFDMTGYKVGDRYSICSVDFIFSTDPSLHVYEWSLLFELAILQEHISLVEGHAMHVTVALTMIWIPVFGFSVPGSYTESQNITRGDGVADNNVRDFWLYVLEGETTVHYRLSG